MDDTKPERRLQSSRRLLGGFLAAAIGITAGAGFFRHEKGNAAPTAGARMNAIQGVTDDDLAVYRAVILYRMGQNGAYICNPLTVSLTELQSQEITGHEQVVVGYPIPWSGNISDYLPAHRRTRQFRAAIDPVERLEAELNKRNSRRVAIPAHKIAAGKVVLWEARKRGDRIWPISFSLPVYNDDGTKAMVYSDGNWFGVDRNGTSWSVSESPEPETNGVHNSL